jgi:hypothetical protein
MTRWILAAAAALAACSLAAGAQATELLFSYQDDFGIQFSFEQLSDPTPISYASGEYTEVPVTDLAGNIGAYTYIIWYNESQSGMFDTSNGSLLVSGPQIYTGSENAPVFAPGVFDGTDQTHDNAAAVLTISVVPEPAGWTLLLAGVAALGLVRGGRSSARAAS